MLDCLFRSLAFSRLRFIQSFSAYFSGAGRSANAPNNSAQQGSNRDLIRGRTFQETKLVLDYADRIRQAEAEGNVALDVLHTAMTGVEDLN